MSFYKGRSITAKHSFMTLSTLRRTHLHLVRMLCASCNTRHSEPNIGCKEWMQACLTLSQKPSPHSLEFWKSLFVPPVSLRDEKTKIILISSQKLRTSQNFLIVASGRQKSVFWRGKLLVSFNLLWSTQVCNKYAVVTVWNINWPLEAPLCNSSQADIFHLQINWDAGILFQKQPTRCFMLCSAVWFRGIYQIDGHKCLVNGVYPDMNYTKGFQNAIPHKGRQC